MEQSVYRQFAELENEHWWFRGRRKVYMGLLAASLGSDMGGDARGRALDLGCGLGGFIPSLKSLGFEVFAADMDFDSLAFCQQRGFEHCSEVDCYQLPYANDSFELVTLFDVAEHIEQDAVMLAEVSRVLKPGGRVMLSVPAYQFLYANNDRIAQHYRRYTRAKISQLLTDAGLTVERNTHTNVFLSPLIIPAVLVLKAVEALFLKRKSTDHTNLSLRMPAVINTILYRVFAAELFLSRRVNLPFGHSIAAIARK